MKSQVNNMNKKFKLKLVINTNYLPNISFKIMKNINMDLTKYKNIRGLRKRHKNIHYE